MKSKLSMFLALAGLLMLGSCAVTDMNQDVDFNQYKTFGWGQAQINVSNPAYKSGLINNKIMKDIETEFSKHGIRYSKENPDLIVSYQTFTQQKQQMSAGAYGFAPYPGFFYRGFWGGPYLMGWPYMPYGQSTYLITEGTLIIDVNDANSGEHIWRGLVKGNVSDVRNLKKSIDKGVRAIIKKYPGAAVPGERRFEPNQRRVS